MSKRLLIVPALLSAIILSGCSSPAPEANNAPADSNAPAESNAPVAETNTPAEPPKAAGTVEESAQTGPVKLEQNGEGEIAKRMPKNGEEIAVMKTNYGRIVIMFLPDKAPNHVKRFKEACAEKIYDGMKFHRVIPNFMIQGGDPNSKDDNRADDGMGGWGEPMKAEFNDVKHVPGILSAARTQEPDSATSQFFLVHGVADFLDNQYTAYGKVLEGLKVIDTIVNLPRDPNDNPNPENPAIIYNVRIEKWPLK